MWGLYEEVFLKGGGEGLININFEVLGWVVLFHFDQHIISNYVVELGFFLYLSIGSS